MLRKLHVTPLGGTLVVTGRPGTPIGVVAQLVGGCRGVRADMPNVPARQALHLRPAGLFYRLPVPTSCGGGISLDFLELPVSSSCHDFLQVHIDPLIGRVWLILTSKTATAETAGRRATSSGRCSATWGCRTRWSRTAIRASLSD